MKTTEKIYWNIEYILKLILVVLVGLIILMIFFLLSSMIWTGIVSISLDGLHETRTFEDCFDRKYNKIIGVKCEVNAFCSDYPFTLYPRCDGVRK